MALTVELLGVPPVTGPVLKLFPEGDDNIANGAGGDALAAATNRKGYYSAIVAENLAGLHTVHVVDVGGNLVFTDILTLGGADSVNRNFSDTTLDEILSSLGSGGTQVITIVASIAQSGQVDSPNLTAYLDSRKSWSFTITTEDGTPVDLSGATIEMRVRRPNGTTLFTAAGSVGGANNNIVTVAASSANHSEASKCTYGLHVTSDDDNVIAEGDYLIKDVP